MYVKPFEGFDRVRIIKLIRDMTSPSLDLKEAKDLVDLATAAAPTLFASYRDNAEMADEVIYWARDPNNYIRLTLRAVDSVRLIAPRAASAIKALANDTSVSESTIYDIGRNHFGLTDDLITPLIKKVRDPI